MTRNASEVESLPVAPQPVLEGPLAALLEWQAIAEGAYSANTLRALKADGTIFQVFLRIARRAVFAGGPEDDPRVHRGLREGKEARYDKALHGHDLARAYGRRSLESLLE
jgi:hypothetical protein